jgi:hypothetical protein
MLGCSQDILRNLKNCAVYKIVLGDSQGFVVHRVILNASKVVLFTGYS